MKVQKIEGKFRKWSTDYEVAISFTDEEILIEIAGWASGAAATNGSISLQFDRATKEIHVKDSTTGAPFWTKEQGLSPTLLPSDTLYKNAVSMAYLHLAGLERQHTVVVSRLRADIEAITGIRPPEKEGREDEGKNSGEDKE